MLEIVTIIASVITITLLKIGFKINFKTIKKFDTRGSEELEKLPQKFPKDEEICKQILEKLENKKEVKIKIIPEYNNCLYTVFNHTITIGKFRQDYMKIQTIAHECIHACQPKRVLWSNFIFSNIYLIYFTIISILAFFNKLPYAEVHLLVFIFLSILQFALRNYLEDDASIKAKSVAKEYIEEHKILNRQEQEVLLREYEEVNSISIPFMNFYMVSMNIVKIMIFAFIVLAKIH